MRGIKEFVMRILEGKQPCSSTSNWMLSCRAVLIDDYEIANSQSRENGHLESVHPLGHPQYGR